MITQPNPRVLVISLLYLLTYLQSVVSDSHHIGALEPWSVSLAAISLDKIGTYINAILPPPIFVGLRSASLAALCVAASGP